MFGVFTFHEVITCINVCIHIMQCLFCFCYDNINHHCRCYLNIFHIKCFIILNDIIV